MSITIKLLLILSLMAISMSQEIIQTQRQINTQQPKENNIEQDNNALNQHHKRDKQHHKQRRHHNKDKFQGQRHMKKHQDQNQEEQYIEGQYDEKQYTEQQIRERKQFRKRHRKIWKYGLIVGVAIISILLIKFCKKSRRQNRARNMNNQNQVQPQPQVQQPQEVVFYQPGPVQINPYAYPVQHQHPQNPQRVAQQQQPIVRGRVHDSFMKRSPVQQNNLQNEIRFHENEILRLKEMKRQQRGVEMPRNYPIKTVESFETEMQMHKKYQKIPMGQPIYQKDQNSSFASQYPQI